MMFMKFLLAPDSFKESMTAKKAAYAMENGIKRSFPDAECIVTPLADGGEGTVEALMNMLDGKLVQVEVAGPLGNKVMAEFGIIDNGELAVIEMASASGLALIAPEDRNPLITTTFGTGQLIKQALDLGVKRIIIGIGGSATNDGGVGMLQALGVRFIDQEGEELPYGGGSLDRLYKIDRSGMDPRVEQVQFDIACDVTNPLIGDTGASVIFGPQKGATPKMVELLDRNLAHLAQLIKLELKTDIAYMPGAGAAGGLGGALHAFLNGRLKKGIELILESNGIEEKIKQVDFVFTGEGSIDRQTMFGKTPYGVASIAHKYNVPVIAFAGKVGDDIEPLYEKGFTAIFGIVQEATSLEEALKNGEENLTKTVESVCRLMKGVSPALL